MPRVIMAGGGTAGHVNPALAIAEIIKDNYPDSEFCFVGNPEKLEAKLVPKAGYRFEPLQIEGFQRKINAENIKRNLHAAMCLAKSGSRCRKIINEFRPDLVIGTGGYVSGPIVRAAAKMGIKTAVHEQNAFAGVTNKLLSKKADVVMMTVGESEKYFPQAKKCVTTGLPVRGMFGRISKEEARKELGIPEDATVVLSAGGSLGAKVLNENIAKLFRWYQQEGRLVYHIHSYGTYKDYENYIDDCEKQGIRINGNDLLRVSSYVDMPKAMAACDLIITRCGAASLAEIEAMGRCSILIPSPWVAENHQYHNGMVLQNAGAGVVIEEKDLTGDRFIETVRSFIDDKEKLRKCSEAARSLYITDTPKRIAEALRPLIGNK
ncbi:MAG: UDP-N-acetylglucosamine--N-acetylmuramyl-(pentapeptide) pyrophosphoryl-undecaprenol N-acetylglucosamine transferase [Ruminococcus sp.]|nr:UDP-N-acetylglucosamine--N-acetylmuramyl-(pentapeptide) pyrophosphoryl-undecaprenol N-acetylglucosamine transferase [Ruminococcus sp.]